MKFEAVTWRVPIGALALTLALGGWPRGAVLASEPEPVRRDSMPLDEIERGQRGYGYTVFAGTEPERFEVEVLGIQRNSQPGASYVIARLTGHDLEKTGVAAGMSGSPVYIDDRLVGAVAFSWPYAEEAIAGITPIENMRAIGELPTGLAPAPTPRVELAALLGGDLPPDLLARELARLAPPRAEDGAPAAAAVHWVATGFGPTTRELLAGALGTLGTGSRSTTGGGPPAAIVDGGPVAGVLISGDYQLAAVGTVTERHGDEVLAFGHAFLGLGPIAVPMAAAEVVTFMPSGYSSFKISNVGAGVGAFEQDHQWGIRGRLGQSAPVIPLHARIEGVRPREFNVELSQIDEFVGALVATVMAGAIETTASSGGPQTVDLDARLRLEGRQELRVQQTFDGDRAPGIAVAWLVGLVNYLASNEFEKVAFEGFDLTLRQQLGHHGLRIETARPARSIVRPGEEIALVLDLRGYRGERERRTVRVQVPVDAPAGKLTLLVGDGASADATRLSLEPVVPRSLDEALGLLATYRTSRELVVLASFPAVGLQAEGRPLPQLPGSMQSIWKSAGGTAPSKPLKSAVRLLSATPSPEPLAGLVRIDLEVRRPEPHKPDIGGGAGARGRGRSSNQEPWEEGR